MDARALIGSAEAARILDLDRATVIRQAGAGRLPVHARVDGRVYVYERAAIDAVAELRRAAAGSGDHDA